MKRPNLAVWMFGVIAAACVVFAVWNLALISLHPADVPCTLNDHPADHGIVDRAWYVIGAPIALVLGRIVSGAFGAPPFYNQAFRINAQTHSQAAAQPAPQPNALREAQVTATWVQLLIVILLSATLVGLSYETIGVAHANNPWPLTYLVRCLNEGSAARWTSVWTLLVTWVVAFIIGNWFWPEPPAALSGSQRSSGGAASAG